MIAGTPDGLTLARIMLIVAMQILRTETHRLRVMRARFLMFGTLFLTAVGFETMLALVLFSGLRLELLGQSISGAGFAWLIPAVVGLVHIRLHHDRDGFTRWWVTRLSSLGAFVIVIGISASIGWAAWEAANDVITGLSSLPTGTFGSQSLAPAPAEQPSLFGGLFASVFGSLSSTLLFAGLSLGMVVTIAFASFVLGRALEALNVITEGPRADRNAWRVVARCTAALRDLTGRNEHHDAILRHLPIDMNASFASEAAHVCRGVILDLRAAAARKFDPMRQHDPLARLRPDPDVAAIPSHLATEAEALRHLAQQGDAVRMHRLLTVLESTIQPRET